MDGFIRVRLSYTPIYSKGSGKLLAWSCDLCKCAVHLWGRNQHDCPNKPLGTVEVTNADKQDGSNEPTGV